MRTKLLGCLLVCLAFGPSAGRAAPGAMAAGPNDFDRFRPASPPGERQSPEIAPEFRALIARGEIALRSKRYDEAISIFSAALQSRPPPAVALIMLRLRSDAHIEKGDLDRALADGNEMVRLDPRHFRGYQVRGRVYRRKGQLDKAIADLNVALGLNPTFAQLYNNRGVAYSDKGEDRRAIEDFNQAIRLAPQSIDGYVNRGGSYFSLRDFPKAMADYNVAIRMAPRDGDA